MLFGQSFGLYLPCCGGLQEKNDSEDMNQLNYEKPNLCSPAYYCLAKNLQQQSGCKHFVHSVVVKHEGCSEFKIGKCYSKKAREEAAKKKPPYLPSW